MKVLVVDDEAIARMSLQYLLAGQGWEVRHARGYFEALGAVKSWKPDVMVCDWKLGLSTGAEVVRAARESLPSLPVVFISGLPVDSLAHQAADIPGCICLQKPSDSRGIGDLIRQIAASSHGAGMEPSDP